MPQYEHPEDMSVRNPQPLVGLEALQKLSPPQGDAMILRIVEELAGHVQGLQNRVKYLEKYETNSGPPIRTVVGDAEFIKVTQTEETVIIAFDEDELKRHIPEQPIPTYLDRYRHCTDPNANPDLYLPSGVADGSISADGVLVVEIGFGNGSQKCYYIIARNVLGAPTQYSTVKPVVDCSVCEEIPIPNPPDPPDPPDPPYPPGDYPYFNGWVVADVTCSVTAAGALVITVKYVNLQTGDIKFEQRLNCCCTTAPANVPVDRWRPCGVENDDSQDIFLHPGVLDMSDSDDPVVQVGSAGCCYRFVEATQDETINISPIFLRSTCDDSDCGDCGEPITPVCEDCISATNSATVVLWSGGIPDLYTGFNGTHIFQNTLGAAGDFLFGWAYQISATNNLNIYCDASGRVWARNDIQSGGVRKWGDVNPPNTPSNAGYREITGELKCVNGAFSGTFKLYGVYNDAYGSDYLEITF